MLNEIIIAFPIYLISALSILLVLVDAFTGKNKSVAFYFSLISLIAVSVASVYTLSIPDSVFTEFNPMDSISKGMLKFGSYTSIFDLIFCIAGILTILAGKPYLEREYEDYKEFYTLIVFSVAGMMMIAHSANLLMIFIGIEIMSISFYILAGFIRTRFMGIESALKYFILGSFATGFLLYGMAMVYGGTKSFDLTLITKALMSGNADLLYFKIGFGMIIVGLSFKVAAFPFHQWAPDVYQGSPTIVTGFMSTAGKAAALVAFIIIGKSFLPAIAPDMVNDVTIQIQKFTHDARMIIAFIAAATMLLGNIVAIVQPNIKRMLAYSSIAHAGFLLMGIVANNSRGFSGIIFYSAAYMFMQIGAFVIVSVLERDNNKLELSEYSGLSSSHPWLAALMAIFMFSLAGLPPFAGFPGKYMLFVAAIESGYTWLTIVAVVSTIISMYFYIGLVLNMYFKEQTGNILKADVRSSKISLAISLVFVFILGIFPSYLMELAKRFF
jgi:NADH-quinone oxidoreductase subunit N